MAFTLAFPTIMLIAQRTEHQALFANHNVPRTLSPSQNVQLMTFWLRYFVGRILWQKLQVNVLSKTGSSFLFLSALLSRSSLLICSSVNGFLLREVIISHLLPLLLIVLRVFPRTYR